MIWCLWAASGSINSHVGVAVPHQRHLVQTVMKGGVITKKLTFKQNSHQLGITSLRCFIAEKGERVVYAQASCVSCKWRCN